MLAPYSRYFTRVIFPYWPVVRLHDCVRISKYGLNLLFERWDSAFCLMARLNGRMAEAGTCRNPDQCGDPICA
jgi:hypothetical protein